MFSRYLKDNALEDMKTELKLIETISDKSNQLANLEMKKFLKSSGKISQKLVKMIRNNADMLRDMKMLRNFIELTEKLLKSESA